MKHNYWKRAITLGHSFFHMQADFEQMWLSRDEAAETREHHMISSGKLMVAIAWNPDRFHSINILLEG
jgi:hypothetical protein